MPLIHLIYVSTAREEFDTPELDRILDTAVRRNGERRVTGMLLYAGGTFMQVLEGEAADVDETFARICRDRRHTGIILIEREAIAARSFDTWSMGFRRLGTAEAGASPGYAPFFAHGFDAAAIGAKPGLALELLLGFRCGR